MPRKSLVQELRKEFTAFKNNVIVILEEINIYNFEKDTLGMERAKTQKIRRLINSLKKGD